MQQNIFNNRIHDKIEHWEKTGNLTYTDISKQVLTHCVEKLCYPRRDIDPIVFSESLYSLEDILHVLDCLSIEYKATRVSYKIFITIV